MQYIPHATCHMILCELRIIEDIISSNLLPQQFSPVYSTNHVSLCLIKHLPPSNYWPLPLQRLEMSETRVSFREAS